MPTAGMFFTTCQLWSSRWKNRAIDTNQSLSAASALERSRLVTLHRRRRIIRKILSWDPSRQSHRQSLSRSFIIHAQPFQLFRCQSTMKASKSRRPVDTILMTWLANAIWRAISSGAREMLLVTATLTCSTQTCFDLLGQWRQSVDEERNHRLMTTWLTTDDVHHETRFPSELNARIASTVWRLSLNVKFASTRW